VSAAPQLHGAAAPEAGPRVTLRARPEPIDLPPARTALIVVDLQNGYASPGGYRDLNGRDVGPAKAVVQNTVRLIEAARRSGMTVIYLQNGWDGDLKNTGGADSPNWRKSNPLKLMRERPELAGTILTHGSWDYALVDELSPRADEFVVPKSRYSGFCGTELDNLLRARNIRHLIFTGIATNVCVESTLRDAYHREYFCVLVSDACQQSGPGFVQDAVLYSVETFLGWVATTASVCRALEDAAAALVPTAAVPEPNSITSSITSF
jgi:ureidoacrylate peracid hydrolase